MKTPEIVAVVVVVGGVAVGLFLLRRVLFVCVQSGTAVARRTARQALAGRNSVQATNCLTSQAGLI